MFKKYSRVLTAVAVFLLLTGCVATTSSYSVKRALESGDYSGAKTGVSAEYKAKGKDELLHYMGTGLVDHASSEYGESNRKLAKAVALGEELQTRFLRDFLKSSLINPRTSSYAGSAYERVYIHYYKALNYLMLAQDHPEKRVEYTEGARVEARKVDVLLTEIRNIKGTYEESKEKREELFITLVGIFEKLQGRDIDRESLIYREDAYIRYLNGVVYELNGEYDDARIAYQKAAELYEKGYSKQYSLGDRVIEQAWFDVVRVMKLAGGYKDEIKNISNSRLSTQRVNELSEYYKEGVGQLIVIAHSGWIPEKSEMNLRFTIDAAQKQLVITPFPTGTRDEKNAQMRWFNSMYADRGILKLVTNFHDRGLLGSIEGLVSKRIDTGPFWDNLESMGLPKAVEGVGVRVTVPYYLPSPAGFSASELLVDGLSRGELVEFESLADLAIQEQLLNAGADLRVALARESSKALLCAQAEDLSLQMLCKVFSLVVSGAETRSWQTLPYSISIKRLALPEGRHQVVLRTPNASGSGIYHEVSREIIIKRGEITIIRERVLPAAASEVLQKLATK